MTIFTQREFYKALITGAFMDGTSIVMDGGLSPDLVDYATSQIAKIDARNASRKTSPAQLAKQAEMQALVDRVFSELKSNHFYFAKDIAHDFDISTPKASAVLRKLVALGKMTVADTKVSGRLVKVYELA